MGFRIRFERTNKQTKKKKKKKGLFRNSIVIFCIAAMMAYTVFGLFMQVKWNIQPEATLTTVFFAALFGELWELSKIKRAKLKNPDSTNNEETGSDE